MGAYNTCDIGLGDILRTLLAIGLLFGLPVAGCTQPDPGPDSDDDDLAVTDDDDDDSSDDDDSAQPDDNPDDVPTSGIDEEEVYGAGGVTDFGLPPFDVLLPGVPWMSQLMDCDSWTATKTCGPTSVAMAVAYKKDVPLSSTMVEGYVEALGQTPPCGQVTNSSQWIQLLEAEGMEYMAGAFDAQGVAEALMEDRPVLAVVYTQDLCTAAVDLDRNCDVDACGNSWCDSGHIMLVVGITSSHVIAHDPGRGNVSAGSYQYFDIAEFADAWHDSGNYYGIAVGEAEAGDDDDAADDDDLGDDDDFGDDDDAADDDDAGDDDDVSVECDVSVPTDYATIQEAVDAALVGDTVCVEPGSYTEDVVLPPIDISLVSTAGATATHIYGASTGWPLSAVTIDAGQTSDTLVQGFTLHGGGGASRTVRVAWSSPTLRNLVVGPGAGSETCINLFESGATIENSYVSGCSEYCVVAADLASTRTLRNVVLEGCGRSGIRVTNDAIVEITNSVIHGNPLYNVEAAWWGHVILSNSLVTSSPGTGIFQENSTATYTSNGFNSVYGNGTAYGGPGGPAPASTDDELDPDYVNAWTGDFSLQPGSPAIDTGNPATEFDDPDGTRNDRGAFGGPLAGSW